MSRAGDFLALLAVAVAAVAVGWHAIARLRALLGRERQAISIARTDRAAGCGACEGCGGCGKGAAPR